MSEKKDQKTLLDSEIVTDERIGRRSSLRMIGAGFLGAAVAAAVGIRPDTAQAQTGPSDADSGPNEDPPGRGRTGYTDRDSGPNEDRPGHGVCALRGVSDSDSGPGEDPGGHGRGPCHN
jgi:hypothetical protein